MTTPFDDDATTASIDSAHDDDIDVSRAPIVVSWTGDDDQAHSLSHSPLTHDHVAFDIHFNSESHTAFFKITANLAFKGKRSRSNIFLFIHPERVRSLDFVEQDDRSVSASKILNTSTYSLHFVLAEPLALVVPKDDYVPKGETARHTLEALQALSRVTRFRVDLPSNTLAKPRLLALCEKTSSDEYLRTTPGVANLAKLYGGKGAQVIGSGQPGTTESPTGGEASGSAERVSTARPLEKDPALSRTTAAEYPPSYDDLGHSPPSYPTPSNKRRRLDSPEDTSKPGLKIEDICRHGFSEIGIRLDRIEKQLGSLGSRLNRVEQRMSLIEGSSGKQPRQSSSEHGDQVEDGLDQRVGCVEERVTSLEGKLEAGLSELAENLDTQLSEVRYDFDTTTLIRIEDEMGVAQTQLEEFVRDEIRNVAEDIDDTIREKLRDALS